jgi:hypothetical protein
MSVPWTLSAGLYAATIAVMLSVPGQGVPPGTEQPVTGLVYAYAAKRVAPGRHLIAACIANIGPDAVRNVSMLFSLDDAADVILSMRSAADSSEINTGNAKVGIGVLDSGGMKRVEILVHLVSMPGGRVLNGNVRFECKPEPAAGDATGARFLIGEQPVSLLEAATALMRQSAGAAVTVSPVLLSGETELDAVPLLGLTAIMVLMLLIAVIAVSLRRALKR